MKQAGMTKLTCWVCKADHEIPDVGFTSNTIVKTIIEKKIYAFDFGPEHKAAVDSLKILKQLLSEYKEVVNEPESEVNRVAGEMRRQIDLKREEIKKKVDEDALQLIKEVDEFEAKCITRINEEKENQAQSSDTIRSIEIDVKSWESSLERFEDTSAWRVVHIETVKRCETLNRRLRPIKRKLFNDSLSQIEAKKQKFCMERNEPLV